MEPPLDGFFQTNLLFFILSLACCALFSFIETSITAIRLFKLKEIAQGTSKYRGLFHVFEHSPNRILIGVLIAYNLSNVLAAVFSNEVMASISKALNISERLGFAIGILVTSTTILLTDSYPQKYRRNPWRKAFSFYFMDYQRYLLGLSVSGKFFVDDCRFGNSLDCRQQC